MSQSSSQSSVKRFNAPFKTPEATTRTPKSVKCRPSSCTKSPTSASEAGYSPYTPKKTPDILSGLSQEQRRIEHKGRRTVAPSPIDLHLTTSQNEDIQHTIGQQVKKAFKRRLNGPGHNQRETHEENSENPRNPGDSARTTMDARERRQQPKAYKFKEMKNASKPPNQLPKSPVYTRKPSHHQSTSKSPKSHPRSPYPPKSPCYQPKPKRTPHKSPRHFTKSPKSQHVSVSPMSTQQYSGNKSLRDITKSPRHLTKSPKSSHFPKSPMGTQQYSGNNSPRHLTKSPRHLTKSPRHLTKSPKSPHFSKSQRKTPQHNGNIGRYFDVTTPKSAGGVSVSSSILGWSPYRDQRAGALGNAAAPTPLYGHGADMTSGGQMANMASVNDDAQSMYEFPVSPKSQRKLMKRKLKSKEKKKVLRQVLEVIVRCSKEMAVFHQRRQQLWDNTGDDNMQDFKRPRLPGKKLPQSRLLHVTASSASGGIVNQEYTILQGGSVQEEYVGFSENYR